MRLAVAIAIALLGTVCIWIAAPYNNFVLGNAFISDDFMPVAALFFILLFVLGVNPVLIALKRRFALSGAQLAVIFGVLLVACVPPGQGLFRHILYPVGATPAYVRTDASLANAYKVLDLPERFFPEPLGFDSETPASDAFLDRLAPGESIPWGKWVGPLWSWGLFFVPYWLMLTAMAMIVYPQWRFAERQPFPLLEIQQALIEAPEPGRRLAPLFRNRLFWVAAAMVMAIHLLYGGNKYFPDKVPAFPLWFDLRSCFAEHPLRYLPYYVKVNRIHFLFLGVAFFMPNRVGFSIWFTQIAYAVFIMSHTAYFPPFEGQMITDHRIGAWIAVPLGVLWIGRRHWADVMRCVWRRPRTEAERSNRLAGGALLAGMAGVFVWLLGVRVPPLWAAAMVVWCFLLALGMTRIVAETGLPLMAPDSNYATTVARLIPAAWRSAPAMFFSGFIGIVSGHLNRLCPTAMICHALGLDRKAGPRGQSRFAMGLFGILVLSLFVCGAYHLYISYHHASTLNGRNSPISLWGNYYFRYFPEPLLREFVQGSAGGVGGRWSRILFGAGLGGGLQLLCQLSPKWPLHPVAMLFVSNWYAHQIWFSVFLGWLLKMLITRYGGARGYRLARPLFVGMVLGEVIAVAFWVVVTWLVAASGGEYQVVDVLPF